MLPSSASFLFFLRGNSHKDRLNVTNIAIKNIWRKSMKKFLPVLALILSLSLLFVACDKVNWKSDADYHWVEGKEDAKAAHVWDGGKVTKEATATDKGEKQFTCTVCGYVKTEEIPATTTHEHTFAETWTTDADYHWHAATCEHTSEVYGKAAHSFENDVCTVCNYQRDHVHLFEEAWTSDENQHWHAAVCGHDVVDAKADHTWNEGKIVEKATETIEGVVEHECTVCGKTKQETYSFADHQHIVGWLGNSQQHWKGYICCDAEYAETDLGDHVYNGNSVCEVCGQYSVLEAFKNELAKVDFGKNTLVLSDIAFPIDDGMSICINHIALNFALDANVNPVILVEFDLDINQSLQVGAKSTDIENVVANYSGKGVIRDYVLYANVNLGKDAMSIIDVNHEMMNVNGEQIYIVMPVSEMGNSGVPVDQIMDQIDQIVEMIYAYSDQIKEVLDEIEAIVGNLPVVPSEPTDPTQDTVFNMFFRAEEVDGVTYYVLSLDSLIAINDMAADITVGNILEMIFGAEYEKAIPELLTTLFDVTVGDVLDTLNAAGIDIHAINAKVNDLIAKYYPGEESSIEEILRAQGLPLAKNLTLAEYIDSTIVRAYTFGDILEMATGAENPENKITAEQVIALVSTVIADYKNTKIYDLVAMGANAIIQMVEKAHISADMVTVSNANTLLAMATADGTTTFANFNEAMIYLTEQNGGQYGMGVEATGHGIFYHPESMQFVLINLATRTIVYPADGSVGENDTFYDMDDWDYAGVDDLEFQVGPAVVTGETVHGVLDEAIKFVRDIIDVRFVLNDKFETVRFDFSVGIKPSQSTTDEGTTAEIKDPVVKELNALLTQVRSLLKMAGVKATVSVRQNFEFGFNTDELVDEALDDVAGSLAEIDDETLKKAVIMEGNLNEEEAATVTITVEDGRKVLSYKTLYERNNYGVNKPDDDRYHLRIKATILVTVYVDEIAKMTMTYKCGNNFTVGIGCFLDATVIDAKYYWSDNYLEPISDKEVAENNLAAKFDYVVGSTKLLDPMYMFEYDATTSKYTPAGYYDGHDFDIDTGVEDYTLVEGDISAVNNDYFTKLTYRCDNCNELFVVYYRGQAPQTTL